MAILTQQALDLFIDTTIVAQDEASSPFFTFKATSTTTTPCDVMISWWEDGASYPIPVIDRYPSSATRINAYLGSVDKDLQVERLPWHDLREQEDFQRLAFHALRELVVRYPNVKEALLWAMREGHIDGSTYDVSWRIANDDISQVAPCCIIGWIMRVERIPNSLEACLDVPGRSELEAFVADIRPGDTSETNQWLALLSKELETIQV